MASGQVKFKKSIYKEHATSNFKEKLSWTGTFFLVHLSPNYIYLPPWTQLMDDILQRGKNYHMMLLTCNFGESKMALECKIKWMMINSYEL